MNSTARSYTPEFVPYQGGHSRAQQAHTVKTLATFLDQKYQLPFGLRIGWDGILGFIPGIGDLATNALSLYIVLQAVLLGAPPTIVMRMGFNLFIDNLFDAIPFVGNFFDIFWKANSKNVALLESYFANPRRAMVRSRFALAFGIFLVVGFALLTIVVAAFAFLAAVGALVRLLS